MAHHGKQPEVCEYITLKLRLIAAEETVVIWKCVQKLLGSSQGLSVEFCGLLQASNIDDVLCHHTSFLDNCLKDCMLTNPELLRIFSKLMSVCVMFTNCMQVETQTQ